MAITIHVEHASPCLCMCEREHRLKKVETPFKGNDAKLIEKTKKQSLELFEIKNSTILTKL